MNKLSNVSRSVSRTPENIYDEALYNNNSWLFTVNVYPLMLNKNFVEKISLFVKGMTNHIRNRINPFECSILPQNNDYWRIKNVTWYGIIILNYVNNKNANTYDSNWPVVKVASDNISFLKNKFRILRSLRLLNF